MVGCHACLCLRLVSRTHHKRTVGGYSRVDDPFKQRLSRCCVKHSIGRVADIHQGLLEATMKRDRGSKALKSLPQNSMQPLHYAIRLGVTLARLHVLNTQLFQKLLHLPGNKLGAIVRYQDGRQTESGKHPLICQSPLWL